MNASVTGDGTALVTLSGGGLVAVTEHGGSVMVHLDIMGGSEAEHVIIRTAGGKDYDLAVLLNDHEKMTVMKNITDTLFPGDGPH